MLQIFQNHQIFSNQEICVISTPTFKLFFMGKLSKHQTINDIKFSVAHWCTTFESEWDFYLNSVSFHMTSEDLVYTFSVSLPLQKKRNTQMSLFSGERNYNFIAQNVFIHVNTVSNESWISKHHKTKKKKRQPINLSGILHQIFTYCLWDTSFLTITSDYNIKPNENMSIISSHALRCNLEMNHTLSAAKMHV